MYGILVTYLIKLLALLLFILVIDQLMINMYQAKLFILNEWCNRTGTSSIIYRL